MPNLTLERTIGRMTFETPLIIGAGICKTKDQTLKALRSTAGGVEIGSITLKERPGNDGDNFYAEWHEHEDGSTILIYTLNSLGMPNPGKDDVTTWARDVIAFAHAHNKLIGCNVAGDTVEEIVMLVVWALELGFDWVTINGGCPNKYKDGVPQTILSFDLEDTEKLTALLMQEVGEGAGEVWWKPSPDNDTLGRQLKSWDLIAACSSFTGVEANNTVPYCYALKDDGTKAIPFSDGYAGMGGPAVKPRALADIMRLSSLHPRLHLIGAGGVTYGKDIVDYLRVNAAAVMCTSVLYANNFNFNILGYMLAQYCTRAGIEL